MVKNITMKLCLILVCVFSVWADEEYSQSYIPLLKGKDFNRNVASNQNKYHIDMHRPSVYTSDDIDYIDQEDHNSNIEEEEEEDYDYLEKELHEKIRGPVPHVAYTGLHFVTVGETVVINCTIVNKDKPVWTHNSDLIIKGENGYNIEKREGKPGLTIGTLTVVRAKKHHSGTYKCTDKSRRAHNVYVLSDNFDYTLPVIMRVGHRVKITCNITEAANPVLAVDWFKDGDYIPEELSERYDISQLNSTLIIYKAEESDIGIYTCRTKMEPIKEKNISVVMFNYKKLPKSTTVTDGDRISINCVAEGKPQPIIRWSKDDKPVEEVFHKWQIAFGPNLTGVPNGSLIIHKSEKDMNGVYKCLIYFMEKSQPIYTETNVRIRGVYAALWPFIGIVAEVVVLTTIILVHEKNRSHNNEEDLDLNAAM